MASAVVGLDRKQHGSGTRQINELIESVCVVETSYMGPWMSSQPFRRATAATAFCIPPAPGLRMGFEGWDRLEGAVWG